MLNPLFAELPMSLDAVVREFDRGVSSKGLIGFALAVVLLVLFVTVLAYWYRTKERSWRYHSRSALWRELCKVHELTPAQRRVLREIARGAGLEPAAAVFLTPAALDRAGQGISDRQRAQELGEIHERLFGG